MQLRNQTRDESYSRARQLIYQHLQGKKSKLETNQEIKILPTIKEGDLSNGAGTTPTGSIYRAISL